MSESIPLTVIVLEPQLDTVAWLRQHVCGQLGGDLMMADSLPAMEAAMDVRSPDLLLLGPGVSALDETAARRLLRSDSVSSNTEVVRLGRSSAAATPRQSRGLGRWLKGTARPPVDEEASEVARRRITVALDRLRLARERRLQGELASRLQAPPPAPAPQHAERLAPAPPVPTAPTPGGGQLGPNSTRFAPLRRAPADPVGGENEWGFFDPGRCGADALAAALDQIEPGRQECSVGRSPADLLLEFGRLEATPPAEVGDPGPAPAALTDMALASAEAAASMSLPEPVVDLFDSGLISAGTALDATATAADLAPAASERAEKKSASGAIDLPGRPAKPFPLALWAHLADACLAAQQRPAALLRYTEAVAGAATLALGLQLPVPAAAVDTATGCRIHRIRVVSSPLSDTGRPAPWAGVAAANTPH